jgi:hypothetical protein
MSRSVSVIITDDLDGSENAETVSFGLGGVAYEVDLAKKNQAKLEKALAPFIEAARRAPASSRSRTAGRAARSSVDRTAVRAWAKAAGLKVSERGRISADIMRQYDEAH